LKMADTDPGGDVASIVINNASFPVGTNLWLKQGSDERMIRLTKLVEFSSAFARYLFEFVRSEVDEDSDQNRLGDEFDDLWNSL